MPHGMGSRGEQLPGCLDRLLVLAHTGQQIHIDFCCSGTKFIPGYILCPIQKMAQGLFQVFSQQGLEKEGVAKINICKRFIPCILELLAQVAAIMRQVESQPQGLRVSKAARKPDSRCQVSRIDMVGMFTKQPFPPVNQRLQRILAWILSLLAADVRREGTQ